MQLAIFSIINLTTQTAEHISYRGKSSAMFFGFHYKLA